MLLYSKDCHKYEMMDSFLMINKERFLVFVYEKKNNLKIKILFFGTQETFINNFFSLRFKLLKDLLTSWCIFSKIIFFSQIKALYIVYCYQGCLGSLINTWRNKINIFLKLWHSSNSLTGLLYLIRIYETFFDYLDLLNCWLQLTYFKLLNGII